MQKERSAFLLIIPENVFRFGTLRLEVVLANFIVDAPGRDAKQPRGLRLIPLRAPDGRFQRFSLANLRRPHQVPIVCIQNADHSVHNRLGIQDLGGRLPDLRLFFRPG